MCHLQQQGTAQMALVDERSIVVDAKLEAPRPRQETMQAEAARQDEVEEIARMREAAQQISLQRDALLLAQISASRATPTGREMACPNERST
jgi:hypothetical protein